MKNNNEINHYDINGVTVRITHDFPDTPNKDVAELMLNIVIAKLKEKTMLNSNTIDNPSNL